MRQTTEISGFKQHYVTFEIKNSTFFLYKWKISTHFNTVYCFAAQRRCQGGGQRGHGHPDATAAPPQVSTPCVPAAMRLPELIA